MALRIPKDNLPAIETIKTLPDTEIDDLVGAITAAHYAPKFEDVGHEIASQLSSIPPDKLIGIIEALDYLYHIREYSGVESAKFLDDLISEIHEKFSNWNLSASEESVLKERFKKLLNIRTLAMICKAHILKSEGERIYCDAKVLSDIRPIFCDDPPALPIGAVVGHTLKIECHTATGHQEFHMVLDSQDIEKLKEVLNRAGKKDKALKELIKNSKLANFD